MFSVKNAVQQTVPSKVFDFNIVAYTRHMHLHECRSILLLDSERN